MAANIQILLSLACIAFGGAHIIDPNKSHSGLPNTRVPHHPKKHPENKDEGNRSNEAGLRRHPEDQRPINGDIFSYNTHHSYNDYYQDGYPGIDPYYFGQYAGPFGVPNFDYVPDGSYGRPSMHNNYNRPVEYPPHKLTNEMDSHGSSGEKPEKGDDDVVVENDDNKKKPPITNEKHETESPKSIKNKNEDSSEKDKDKNDKTVDLNAKKDYLLVDNNGHSYLLHENAANNVVYVPVSQNNPQQPNNQVYQVVNGNPPVTANVPITANKLNGYGNVMTYPAQGNALPNNNNPGYILVYANGQLIQIPGIVVNTPQNHIAVPNGNQGSNVFFNVPNNNVQNAPVVQYPPNIMYANVPNQGNNPMTYQVPNTVAVPNNVPNTGTVNTQPGVNTNINNNNVGAYTTGSQPSYGNQINQPVNGVNPNPAGTVNYPVVQPAITYPGVNNGNVYQPPIPSQYKEPNVVPSTNNTLVGNLQPPVATNNTNGNGYLSNAIIQPAIMVSGFKESDKGKKVDKKENENENEKKEIKEDIKIIKRGTKSL